MDESYIQHAIDSYLLSKGYDATRDQFREESGLTGSLHDAPSMEELLELWLARRKSLSTLSVPKTVDLDIPKHSTVTLYSHATNVLSLQHTIWKRKRFDTALADYVEESLPCLVSTAADRSIKLTHSGTGDVEEAIMPSSAVSRGSVVLCVALHENLLACGSMDGSLHVIDLSTNQPVFAVKDHAKYVVRVGISDDGQWLASASYDKTICGSFVSSAACLIASQPSTRGTAPVGPSSTR
jgi:WD40 repeat protein